MCVCVNVCVCMCVSFKNDMYENGRKLFPCPNIICMPTHVFVYKSLKGNKLIKLLPFNLQFFSLDLHIQTAEKQY